MNTSIRPIDELINELSAEDRQIARQFIEFLLIKRHQKSDAPLRQDWAGALKAYRNRYTALELQEKALEWRSRD